MFIKIQMLQKRGSFTVTRADYIVYTPSKALPKYPKKGFYKRCIDYNELRILLNLFKV